MPVYNSSADGVTYSFPDPTVPEAEKQEEYHRKATLAITNQSLHDNFALSYGAIQNAYDFYQGMNTGDEFNFLQESEDGDVLPAKWMNFNTIKKRIDLIGGELIRKNYEIRVESINKDAKVRKLEEREAMRIQIRLQDLSNQLEEKFGMPMQNKEGIPETEEELDEKFEGFKEIAEYVIESAVRWLVKVNKWDYERYALFRDVLIAGRCFAKSEIVNGRPTIRRIDPRFMVFDANATNDFLSDASYFGEIRYTTLGQAIQEYNLDKEEIKEVYRSYKDIADRNTPTTKASTQGTLMEGTNLEFFKRDRGELRVLIFYATWRDYKTISYKEATDKYGNMHFKSVSDTDPKATDKRRIEIWRQGTMIGGKLFKDWGETKNNVRSVDNLSLTQPEYFCCIPNYLSGVGISKVQQMASLQKLKDITYYQLQVAMSRAGAKGFVYDVAQLPEGWSVHNAIKYLKVAGIAFINSAKDGYPASFNQFQQFDMSLSASVQQYLQIIDKIEAEMDSMTGISEARQGQVAGASQAVGVTQSSLFQSSLVTENLFTLFNDFASRTITHQAGLTKFALAKNKEAFAPIIGDVGVDFLSQDIDFELNDYGITITVNPPIIDDHQNFQNIVTAALQAGQLNFLQAMNLLLSKDIREGVRLLEKSLAENEKKQLEQQMALQEQQSQLQQQSEQAKQEFDTDKFRKEMQSKAQLESLNQDGKMQQVLAKGRIDLLGKKIDAKGKAKEKTNTKK